MEEESRAILNGLPNHRRQAALERCYIPSSCHTSTGQTQGLQVSDNVSQNSRSSVADAPPFAGASGNDRARRVFQRDRATGARD